MTEPANGTDPAQSPINRLQELVLTRLTELGDSSGAMTAREAARRANWEVSYETLRNIARGVRHNGRLTDRVAMGIAKALDVPPERVYAAAGLPQPGSPWEWPERFNRLSPNHRALVEEVASALLEADTRARRGE
jgi:hypothetical protein